MKIKAITLAAAAAVFLSSCGGEVKDVTKINGTVNIEDVTEVHVQIENVIDTLVPVVDKKFSVELPKVYSELCSIEANPDVGLTLISDGTPITVVIDEESTATSKYPKLSVNEKYNVFSEGLDVLMEEYNSKGEEIYADTVLTSLEKDAKFQEFFDEFIVRFSDYHKKALAENTDNFVSVYCLMNISSELEDAELESLIKTLSPEVQNNSTVKEMSESITARLNTSEGKMFTDFTVSTVTGFTRSIPPQPKYQEVKFSDYVGKGKYILVDFWAPWCGPCKREIPNIKAVHDKYAGKDFDVLSIAVWEREDVKVTIDTAAELGMDWLHINNAESVPTDIYGIEGIPHLMLIGPDGTILKRGLRGEDIETEVAKYVSAK